LIKKYIRAGKVKDRGASGWSPWVRYQERQRSWSTLLPHQHAALGYPKGHGTVALLRRNARSSVRQGRALRRRGAGPARPPLFRAVGRKGRGKESRRRRGRQPRGAEGTTQRPGCRCGGRPLDLLGSATRSVGAVEAPDAAAPCFTRR
jgi:hypothetical protein